MRRVSAEMVVGPGTRRITLLIQTNSFRYHSESSESESPPELSSSSLAPAGLLGGVVPSASRRRTASAVSAALVELVRAAGTGLGCEAAAAAEGAAGGSDGIGGGSSG